MIGFDADPARAADLRVALAGLLAVFPEHLAKAQPPTWFVGPSMTHFNVSSFSANLSHLSTTAGSTLTSSPRSSGGSGFGGGGSSGGGGGGGGGGAF